MINLTPEQQAVHDAMVLYAQNPDSDHITVGGYAGTGKTTITAAAVKTIRKLGARNVGFCCYTGKASSVLRAKLQAAGVLLQDSYCGTIHSLIYKPVADERGRHVRFDRVPDIDESLLVIDEASMVNESIWRDLLSYKRPIIAVGDHGQLPPIEGEFNLMQKPMHRLEKIHRQAEDNPIIRLAMMARETGEIPMGKHGVGVWRGLKKDDQIIADGLEYGTLRTTLYLCGFNKTRVRINKRVREALGYTGQPKPGEKVICLKNNREAQIFNGLTGIVRRCNTKSDLLYYIEVDMENGVRFEGNVLIAQFGAETTMREHPLIQPKQMSGVNLFDFGYCLTVHKAQGSEADSVTLIEERSQYMDDDQWKRWLYTGVTRAKKYLTIVNRRWTPRPAAAV